jgi:hypothetical protein
VDYKGINRIKNNFTSYNKDHEMTSVGRVVVSFIPKCASTVKIKMQPPTTCLNIILPFSMWELEL